MDLKERKKIETILECRERRMLNVVLQSPAFKEDVYLIMEKTEDLKVKLELPKENNLPSCKSETNENQDENESKALKCEVELDNKCYIEQLVPDTKFPCSIKQNIKTIKKESLFYDDDSYKCELDSKEAFKENDLLSCKNGIKGDYNENDSKVFKCYVKLDSKCCIEQLVPDTKFPCSMKQNIKTITKESLLYDNDSNKCKLDSKEEFENMFGKINSDRNEAQMQSIQNSAPMPLTKQKKKYIKPYKFECNHCYKRFTQSDILRHHIRIHTGERPHKCSYCDKLFRTKSVMKLHSRIHTGKPHVCSLCEKRFNQIGGLKIHMLTHFKNTPFKCGTCDFAHYRKSSLLKHTQKVHSELTNGSDRKSEQKSKSIHAKNKPVDNSLSERFICVNCKKSLKTKRSLLNHLKTCEKHEGVNEKLFCFTCGECSLSFKTKLTLLCHIQYKHSDIKPYVCSVCNASFKSKSNLSSHIEVHNNKTRKYFCDTCNMGFYRLRYLERHSKIHSGSDKKFICDICGCRCRSKTDIGRHIHTHVGGETKPYQCSICGKAFIKPSHLHRHLLVHGDKKPYECSLCDKAYKDSVSLKQHKNTIHLKKTHTCDRCGFVSKHERSFKRHVSQDTCTKIECDVCGKRYSSNGFLKIHINSKHSENISDL